MFDADDGDETPVPDTSSHHVTAIVVTHDGRRWLPQTLRALAAQSRAIDHCTAVDTGSRDDSGEQVRAHPAVTNVIDKPRDTAFGAAVAAAVAVAPPVSTDRDPAWFWLLHDDAAPAPDALAVLLVEAALHPEAAVIGPKLREWPSLRRLLEVGVTLSGTGHRETGLEPGEPDQGQRDWPGEVLAVSTAGMLVKRDVWEQLSGFDRHMPFHGDDLDFGWRVNRAGHQVRTAPQAVVFHAEAMSRGLREHVGAARPRRLRRAAALRTLLVNGSRPGAAFQLVRLLLGSMLRALAFLLAKAPAAALDELAAAASVYGRPWRLLAARRVRARTAVRSARDVRPLLPSPLLPYRSGVHAGMEVLRSFTATGDVSRSGRRAAVVEPGPVADEAEDLPAEHSPIRWLVARPLLAIFVTMVVLAVVTARSVLGGGPIQGGALLPVPDGALDWWGRYLATWHDVGLGGPDPLPPYVSALATASSVLFGQPRLVIDIVVLAAAPLALLTAHRMAGAFIDSARVAMWWAVTYALLVATSGAVEQGRLGTLVGAVVAPLVVRTFADVADAGSRTPGWQRGLRLGAWTSLLVAFVPLGYPLVVLAGVALLVRRRGRNWLPLLLGVAVPWVLLGPWMLDRVASLDGVWWEAGLPDAGVGPLDPGVIQLMFGHASDAGPAPWLSGGVVLAGLAALVRTERRRAVLATWVGGLLGLALAVLGAGQRIDVGATTAAAWVGFPLLVWAGALAFAGALAADGAGADLMARSFGWRQAVLATATGLAVLTPLVLGVGWVVQGVDGPLRDEEATAVPTYLAAAAAGPLGQAVLVLDTDTDGTTTYDIIRGDGARLGEEVIQADPAGVDDFEATLTQLLSEPDSQAIAELADRGVAAIVTTPDADPDLASTLDGAPGLQSTGTTDPTSRAWKLTVPSGSVRVVPGPDADGVRARVVDSTLDAPLQVTVDAGPDGRLLVLSAPSSQPWQAEADGQPLEPTTFGADRQAFRLPATGGGISISYESDHRWWVLLRVVAALIVIVLAAPGRRRQ